MAGAYAYLYNRLVQAVKSVESETYTAEQDCLILLVSPGYLSDGLNDDEWQIGLQYWSSLSALLSCRDKVFPGFREVFINHTDSLRRAPQLKSALATNGEQQSYGIIYFYGADGHHNDKLFLATPALNYVFEGVDMLLTSCGHSYAEPQQLLNAEYMWNPHNSGFFNLSEKPADYVSFKKLYFQSQYNQFKPKALYEDFLKTACAKLYGEVAGSVMYEMFRIEGKNQEPPIPYLNNSGLIRGEMRGSEANAGLRQGSVFEYYCWPCQTAKETKDLIRERIQQSLAATVQASDILEKGLNKDNIEAKSRDYLRWYAASLTEGARYVGYLENYMVLVDGIDTRQTALCVDQIHSLLSEVTARREYNMKSRLQPIDYLGGSLSGREEIIIFVESNLKKMLADIIGKEEDAQ
jgi:hypothetical protein